MNTEKAIKKRRSIRKFKDKEVPYETLKEIVNSGRLAPSAMNKQPLEFLIVDDNDLVKRIFSSTSWAGFLDWNLSIEKRPGAFILILVNKEIKEDNYQHDSGLAAENICLSAVERGLGTCILGSINKKNLREILEVPESKLIDIAIGVGYPDQEAVMEEAENPIEYWMDENGTIHVPKRKLEDIIHHNKPG